MTFYIPALHDWASMTPIAIYISLLLGIFMYTMLCFFERSIVFPPTFEQGSRVTRFFLPIAIVLIVFPLAAGLWSFFYGSLFHSAISALLLAITAIVYLFGFWKVDIRPRMRRIFWFWPTSVTRYAQSWTVLLAAAVVWTFLVCGLSFSGLIVDSYLRDWAQSHKKATESVKSKSAEELWTEVLNAPPGLLAIASALAFTLAGLLNTIALLNQRSEHIIDFRGLFLKMDELVREVLQRNRDVLPHQRGEPRENYAETAFLLDYTPLIGEVSRGRLAWKMYKLLEQLRSVPSCECHFVFLASSNFELAVNADKSSQPAAKCTLDDRLVEELIVVPESHHNTETTDGDLEKFYKRLLGRRRPGFADYSGFLSAVREYVQQAEERMDRLDGDNVAVWRSRRIHSEHYFVTKDSALQYYVTPEADGEVNELKGEKTSDLSEVEFLKEVVLDYIRDAVTPHIELVNVAQNSTLEMVFSVGQAQVEAVEVYFGKELQDVTEKNLIRFVNNRRTAYNQPASETDGHRSGDERLFYREIRLDNLKIIAGEKYVVNVSQGFLFEWIRVRLRKASFHPGDENEDAGDSTSDSEGEHLPPVPLNSIGGLPLCSPFSYHICRRLIATRDIEASHSS